MLLFNEIFKSGNWGVTTFTGPMEQGIVKAPGSFNFGGSLFWRIALQFSERAMFSSSFGFLLPVNNSFMNFAYTGI